MAGHSCGHEHHEHDHSGPDLGALYSLYTKIDIEKVECLNEETDGSGKCVFKAWDKRMETDKVPSLCSFFKLYLFNCSRFVMSWFGDPSFLYIILFSKIMNCISCIYICCL